MAISAAKRYSIGILSLLLFQHLLGGEARQQEPIQILYGTSVKRPLSNGTTLHVDPLAIMRLQLTASRSIIQDMSFEIRNITLAFHEPFQDVNITALIHTHYLRVTESGSITIRGVLEETDNTDYHLVLYFNVEREGPTTITEGITSTETVDMYTTTQGGETTSTTIEGSTIASAIGNPQVDRNTFIAVVVVIIVVIIVVALSILIVTVGALAIYYRKKLKDLKHRPDTSIAP